MLKKLLCLMVLTIAAGTLTGCHAGAHTNNGHGADVNVG